MFTSQKRSLAFFAALVALLSLWFLGGCDSKSRLDDPVASNTAITVTSSPVSVEQNGTSVVEAIMTSGGAPVMGESVTFTVTPASAGYFTPETVVTDASGAAATIFTATTVGAASISATADNVADKTASTGIDITDALQGVGSGNVTLTVSPNLLLANGADSAVVTVTVRDALGQLAPDSTLVRISAGEKFIDADGNGYWSAGSDTLVFDANANGIWDAIGLIPSTARTVDGAVTVIFYAGSEAQTVYIKVSVNEGDLAGEAETSLQLSPDATPDFIYLSSDSMQLAVTQTGGIQVSWLRATVYDVNANRVPEGVAVSFHIIDGPGGGEHLMTADSVSYSTVTNSQGVASTTIHSGSIPGTIRIRAQSGGVLSNATQILVSAGPPAYITLGAASCNMATWAMVGVTNDIVAVVSDIYLNPVNDSTVVYFSCDEGTMKSHEARTQKYEGIAETIWISGTQDVPSADGKVWYWAETAGGTVRCSTFFYSSQYPDTMHMADLPVTMVADGVSKAYVWVWGVDLNGNPVISGTSFKGRATGDLVSVVGGTLENGCWGSSAEVEVTTKVLVQDYSVTGANDDGIGGVTTVTFRHAAGASVSQNVTLTTGFAYSGNSNLVVKGSPGAGDLAVLTVTIKDRPGNPLADHTIELADLSTLETDGYGEAQFGFLVPGAPGSYTVTVKDLDARGSGLMLSVTIVVE